MAKLGKFEQDTMLEAIEMMFDLFAESDALIDNANQALVSTVRKVSQRHLDSGDPFELEDYFRKLLVISKKRGPRGRRPKEHDKLLRMIFFLSWDAMVEIGHASALMAGYLANMNREAALQALRAGADGVKSFVNQPDGAADRYFFGDG